MERNSLLCGVENQRREQREGLWDMNAVTEWGGRTLLARGEEMTMILGDESLQPLWCICLVEN